MSRFVVIVFSFVPEQHVNVFGFETEQAAGAAALHLVRLKEAGRDQYCCGDGWYLFHNGLRWPRVFGEWAEPLRDFARRLTGGSESGRNYGPELRPEQKPEEPGCGTPDQETLQA